MEGGGRGEKFVPFLCVLVFVVFCVVGGAWELDHFWRESFHTNSAAATFATSRPDGGGRGWNGCGTAAFDEWDDEREERSDFEAAGDDRERRWRRHRRRREEEGRDRRGAPSG